MVNFGAIILTIGIVLLFVGIILIVIYGTQKIKKISLRNVAIILIILGALLMIVGLAMWAIKIAQDRSHQ